MSRVSAFLKQKLSVRSVTLLVIVVVLSVWCYQSYLTAFRFPVKKILVHASYKHLSYEEIEATILPYISAGFFKLHPSDIEQAINRLEWVASSEVKRRLPFSLDITLLEHQPVARWGESSLLTKDATLFQAKKGAAEEGLVLLNGPANYHTQVLHEYQKIQAQLAPLSLRIASYKMDENYSRELLFDNGCGLYLGRHQVDSHLMRFINVYSHVFRDKLKRIAYIDLRYAHGMAVKWRSSSQTNV